MKCTVIIDCIGRSPNEKALTEQGAGLRYRHILFAKMDSVSLHFLDQGHTIVNDECGASLTAGGEQTAGYWGYLIVRAQQAYTLYPLMY